MIVKKDSQTEDLNTKLNISKKVSTNLSSSLQLLNERFMTCVKDIDTSEIEDVDFINGLIAQFNDLIEAMSKNQKKKFKRIEFVKLTDEQGNPVTDYKIWVVGELYIEDGKPNYYKRRIVRARTMKEAVYKNKKTDSSLTNSLTCFGEKDNTSDYSLGIEIEDIID